MLRLQQQESLEAEQKRLHEERQKREALRRKQELQEIEKKQAMDKIAALKKTSVGAKALKDLTEEVINFIADISCNYNCRWRLFVSIILNRYLLRFGFLFYML